MIGDSIFPAYFDASALVKLFAEDEVERPGRDAVRSFYYAVTSAYTSNFCLAECLSALKGKYRRKGPGQITQEQYLAYVAAFYRLGVGHRLQVDEVDMLQPDLREMANRLVRTYDIDVIDAVQVVTLLRGRYRYFSDGSQSVLVTADRALARAARAEGARAWLCIDEAPPS